jgi:uncharacterized membrane protein YhhN
MMGRAIWWAAIIAGASYLVPVVAGWNGPATIAWKGAGVGLLALWAAVNARDFDGWLIAAVMALGALGDVLLDAKGLETGAAAFAAGHLLAIWLYARHRRAALSPSQRGLALLLVPLSLAIVWGLLRHEPGWWHAAIYTALVATMAAMAWTSAFPRYRTGLGAIAFLLSDLLIFARLGGAVPPAMTGVAIWVLYFGGQAMIALGVVTSLRAARVQPGMA